MRICHRSDPLILISYAGLTAALLLVAAAAVDFWQTTATEEQAATVHDSPPTAFIPEIDESDGVGVESLVRTTTLAAPFRPDRTPAPERYVPPSKRETRVENDSEHPSSALRLVGTAVLSNGRTMAAFQLPEAPPILAGEGSLVEGLRVVEVVDGRAILAGRDSTLVFGVEPRGENP